MPAEEKMSKIQNQHSKPFRVLLCLDGEPPSKKTTRKLLQETELIVAADGAANWLVSYGIVPDFVVGDLDGIKPAILTKFPRSNVIKITEQYSTDFEKTMSWIVQQGYTDVIIAGISGKRVDHMLSNFQLVWNFIKKINIEIVGDDWSAITMQNEKKQFHVPIGMTISLIPFSACKGITLRGFKYNLANSSMKLGEVGVSNLSVREVVSVEILRGSALMVFQL